MLSKLVAYLLYDVYKHSCMVNSFHLYKTIHRLQKESIKKQDSYTVAMGRGSETGGICPRTQAKGGNAKGGAAIFCETKYTKIL